MTVRTDVLIDWEVSPRIIKVFAPSVEMTVQDLVDTCRYFEAQPINVDNPHLINAAGKEELGGGVTVGITATLLNAQVQFEGRFAPRTLSTATQSDATGQFLTDSAADFVSDGVIRGDTVFNIDTGDLNTVLEVLSATELRSQPIEGGTGAGWMAGDNYAIYLNQRCNLSGGNLVANDENGQVIDPILASPNTSIVRTSSSSATLQELADIQYSSFNGVITVDVTSPYNGTVYPTGTPRQPVNNITDAYEIAIERGFTEFFIIGDLTINQASPNLQGFTFSGQGMDRTHLTLDALANVIDCMYKDAHVLGTLDGNSRVVECLIDNLVYVRGFIEQCVLAPGTIVLAGSEEAHFLDCWSGVPGQATPTIDCGGSGQALALRNYNGGIRLTNKNGADSVSIDLNSGQVKLGADVTAGTVVLRGVGTLTEDLSSGATIVNQLVNPTSVAQAVWDQDSQYSAPALSSMRLMQQMMYGHKVFIDENNGSPGTAFPLGTPQNPVDNFSDAITIAQTYQLGILHVIEDATIGASDDVSGFMVEGGHPTKSEITVANGAKTELTHFMGCSLFGVLDGWVVIRDSTVEDLERFQGIMHQVMINPGTIRLAKPTQGQGLSTSHLLSCYSGVPGINTPEIDFFDLDVDLAIRDYVGGIRLINKSQAGEVSVDMSSGQIILDNSVTAGTVVCRGVAKLIDQSNGASVVDEVNNRLVNADAVWTHATATVLVDRIEFIKNIEGGRWSMVNDQMIFYAEDNVTEVARFNLFDSTGTPSLTNVFQRQRV